MDIDISILIMLNVCCGRWCVTWQPPESDCRVGILDLSILTPWPWAHSSAFLCFIILVCTLELQGNL